MADAVSWQNHAFHIYRRRHGDSQFEQKRTHALQECSNAVEHGGGPADRVKMNVSMSRVKKMTSSSSLVKRRHGVGAVGYAVVQPDQRIPDNQFFEPQRKFRIRFRHSNVSCTDDASCCIREAAIKFADQNVESPLDLILLTGRKALARNVNSFIKVLKTKTPDDVRTLCQSDPLYYEALVDGLRQGPSSFASLVYHSQLAYEFVAKDGRARVAKFRLVPVGNAVHADDESGMLDATQQDDVTSRGRRHGDGRPVDYLRQEFTERLQRDEPVTYQLQIQINDSADRPYVWNPQLVWDEDECPWLNVALIQLTTSIPCRALCRTYFSILEKPQCLRFRPAKSSCDPHSYQLAWSNIYTELEMSRTSQMADDDSLDCSDGRTGESSTHKSSKFPMQHIVSVCTAPIRDGGTVPRVDVYITFTGTHCRTTPQQLTEVIRPHSTPWLSEYGVTDSQWTEHYVVNTDEQFGELVAIIVSVRHRGVTQQWYLQRVVVVSDPTGPHRTVRCFPCHDIVLARVTLRTGTVCLAEKQLCEVHRQERQLELCERRHEYQWSTPCTTGLRLRDESLPKVALPRLIHASTVKGLPDTERLKAAKFTGLRWDIDPVVIEYFRYLLNDVVGSAGRKNSASHQAQLNRSLSSSSNRSTALKSTSALLTTDRRLSDSATPAYNSEARRCSMFRQFSTVQQQQQPAIDSRASSSNKALARWKKVKYAIKFASVGRLVSVHLPEGAKGDMCRAVQNDVDFARWFLTGANPIMLRRCTHIPTDRFPVTDEMMTGLLDRTKCLADEARNGYVYLVDYALLHDIPTVRREADHRYVAAPLVLLYVRRNGNLVPLAIQLRQQPAPDNPVWTPRDRPENWILAKLWVQNADYQWQFAISHLFRCHWLMEPFVVSAMRQLSSAHPVYKLLKPYFRYTLTTNTLIRNNLLHKSGHIERFTSLGLEGFYALIRRYWASSSFTFNDLDPVNDLRARGVDDEALLPNYLYRDDALRVWTHVRRCVEQILALFYRTDKDVMADSELQSWLTELIEVGFSGHQSAHDDLAVSSLGQLADLVSRLIFTLTAQHSATHMDAMDLYGFIPDVPAMMRRPLPTRPDFSVTRDELSATLPDQFPDAYYVALAFVIQVHKPDEKTLCGASEVYFVERDILKIHEDFRQAMCQLSRAIKARNDLQQQYYENVCPQWIAASAEPIPYISRDAVKRALLDGPKLSRDVFVNAETTKSSTQSSLELMTLPVCLQFARTLGARSLVGRRMIAAERLKAKQSQAAVAAAVSRRTRSVSEQATTSSADAGAGSSSAEAHVSKLKTVVRSKRRDSLNI